MSGPCLVCEARTLGDLDTGWTRCARCGFVAGPDGGREGNGYRWLHASGRGAELEHARRAVYAPVLERFPPWGGRRCLDVGSGSGIFAKLAAAAGWQCVGVDPAGPEVVDGGLRLVRAAFPPPPAGAFELVTFFNSLNYMVDPVAALTAARAAVAPGGSLVVRVPNVGFHLAVRRLARAVGQTTTLGRWLAQGTVLHPRSFSSRALRVALARAGFVAVTIEAGLLTPGDPYATGTVGLRPAKVVTGLLARGLDRVSGHRLLVGATLLATTMNEGSRGPRC